MIPFAWGILRWQFPPELERLPISRADVHTRLATLGPAAVDLTSTGSFVYERERYRDVAGEIGLGSVATDHRTYTGAFDNLLSAQLGRHALAPRAVLAARGACAAGPTPGGRDQGAREPALSAVRSRLLQLTGDPSADRSPFPGPPGT